MSDHKERLAAAIEAFNKAERMTFMLTVAARWLDGDGPTYVMGEVRVKALFVDIFGRHWADGALAAESLAHAAGDRTLADYHHERLCHPDVEVHDLWVYADTRGRWNALVAPVDVIAAELGYPPPVLLPGRNWARTWTTLPDRTDEQELAWVAAGGWSFEGEATR
ncbi:hypothetical protein ABTY96_28395 [Streptomyces sp. NPDC096057]|uniref:hypothetical protein n=1 Tax=Streptomyces sp. NPDC096057 TaxID=3155543 RepID=UPI003331404E